MRNYWIYIVASKPNGTIYIGVTNNLIRRIYEHREGLVPGFSKQYGVHRLVYYEMTKDVREAIAREKQLKKWNRLWKIELIEKNNPLWEDLYDALSGDIHE